MYQCEYFKIYELVPRQVYHDRGEKAWELLDERVLITLDQLRRKYGPMTVNNYEAGGDREWSGLRTKESPFYSPYSQHTFGRAADCLFSHASVDEVRKEILRYPQEYAFIHSLELDVNWLHFDVRNCDRIKTYTP
jgi:hypothetical protein